MGIWLLSENLKASANPRLRRIAAYWVPNHHTAWGWGVLAGGVSQNMSALIFITINTVRANLLSTQRAFAFILGGNVGTGTLDSPAVKGRCTPAGVECRHPANAHTTLALV